MTPTDAAAIPTTGRPRPRWLQALGVEGPPAVVEVEGALYDRVDLFKHDSWAATALYSARADGRPLLCKFHRRQSLCGLPMSWLGRALARHEAGLLARLADTGSVPRLRGELSVEGRVLPNAVAREFIAGHPMLKGEAVDDAFFPRLESLLGEMHRRGIAYVDLHKRENIVVGDDGAPYLIDFQISVRLPRIPPLGMLLRVLQDSDAYHLRKHWAKARPDQCGYDSVAVRRSIPWWIRAHRLIAVPFREARRRLLVALRVRRGRGRVETEHLAEDALRHEGAESPSHSRAA